MGKANKMIDRYEGAMLGVAVGDAMGAPLEFMSAAEIKRKHGEVREMLGGGWLNVEPGEVTDDTQMTLAVAEGIAAAGADPFKAIGENFLRWYGTRPKDVGNTCASVLSTMAYGRDGYEGDWQKAAAQLCTRTNGKTAGNGALMRTVYPALYYRHTSTAEDVAVRIGRMTHWHGTSDHTVRAYTEAVHTIANSEISPEDARAEMERIMVAVRKLAEKQERTAPQPTGYCLDSLMCAINAIRDTDSFEDALVCATNLGGDADTIGAIAGGLAGAIYGASQIPLRWINALANEPNRRTIQLFHETGGAEQQGNANTIVIRLADLARAAYEHHGKE